MKTISDFTNRAIKATDRKRREGKENALNNPIELGNKKARHATYEIEIFNFLLKNKTALGIESVIRFTNFLVDGKVVLTNGKRLAIEIKLRMNWLKACQTEWQLRQYLRRFDKSKEVDAAIVFFEEFSGDWNLKKGKAKNEWGWEAWYLFYKDAIDGKPMDLLMLNNNSLSGYPS
jgi:hypothetical protein